MPKGKPHKRYTPEFKKLVVETMRRGNLSCRETERRFEIPHNRAANGNEYIWKKGRKAFPLSIVDEEVTVVHANCLRKQSKSTVKSNDISKDYFIFS